LNLGKVTGLTMKTQEDRGPQGYEETEKSLRKGDLEKKRSQRVLAGPRCPGVETNGKQKIMPQGGGRISKEIVGRNPNRLHRALGTSHRQGPKRA